MKTLISIKTDKEVKENAKKAAAELGLSLSDVINASLRNFIRTREVYISAIPKMTPELERLLGPIEKDLKTKSSLSPALSSLKEAEDYLGSL